jgi:predicted pyridoxine 5'-phosphate oxidase superfamily flavin-nucleotide-binding protein
MIIGSARRECPLEDVPGSGGERSLQHRFGTGERARRFYGEQLLDHLNPAMRAFIARQEMMFLATSDARGECDNSFRGGPAGFVLTLDARRLAWPEYRGNGVMASLGNIAENPHVGLLFVDFFEDCVGLHVNGSALIVEDRDLRTDHPDLPVDPVPGRRSERWVVAQVREAYIHCAKFVPRLYRGPAEGDHNRGRLRQRRPGFVEARRAAVPVAAPRPVQWPAEWSRRIPTSRPQPPADRP